MSYKPEKIEYQTLGNCAVHGLVLHKNGKDCVKCWGDLKRHQLKHEVDKAFNALFLEVQPSIANNVRIKVTALLRCYEEQRADLTKPSEKTQAELQRLFDVVDQLIKNSQPIEHIGVVVKSTAAWQALMNAWQYHKADGMVESPLKQL